MLPRTSPLISISPISSHYPSAMIYYTLKMESLTLVLGILFNAILLYLIKTSSSPFIGKYQYLIAAFALYDIILCVVHGLLNPVVIVIGNTFGSAMYSPLQSHITSAMFYACFSIPIALMNIHFLYRYWSVTKPHFIERFSRPRFIALVCAYPIAQLIVWFFCALALSIDADDVSHVVIKERLHKTHDMPIDDGWLVMDHWRNGKLNVHVLILLVVVGSIMTTNMVVAVMLATRTYRQIMKTAAISSTLVRLQHTLFIAVCVQTAVPVLCVYTPYFIINMCPLLSIPVYDLANSFTFFVSIFPGWDALVIILLIRDYRDRLLTIIQCKRYIQVNPSNTPQYTFSTY